MGETRKLAAILLPDVVGYSLLAGVDEDRTLARRRGVRSDLIDLRPRPSRPNRQAHRRRQQAQDRPDGRLVAGWMR